jgi:hypothetical protein
VQLDLGHSQIAPRRGELKRTFECGYVRIHSVGYFGSASARVNGTLYGTVIGPSGESGCRPQLTTQQTGAFCGE